MSLYKILNNVQIKFFELKKRKFLIICKVLMKPMEKEAQLGCLLVNVKIPTSSDTKLSCPPSTTTPFSKSQPSDHKRTVICFVSFKFCSVWSFLCTWIFPNAFSVATIPAIARVFRWSSSSSSTRPRKVVVIFHPRVLAYLPQCHHLHRSFFSLLKH